MRLLRWALLLAGAVVAAAAIMTVILLNAHWVHAQPLPGGPKGYGKIQNNGTTLPSRDTLNFIGSPSGVMSCADGSTKTNCTVTATCATLTAFPCLLGRVGNQTLIGNTGGAGSLTLQGSDDAGTGTVVLKSGITDILGPGVGGQLAWDDASGDRCAIQAPSNYGTASGQAYTLPTAIPTTNGSLLSSTTAGIWSWLAPTSDFVVSGGTLSLDASIPHTGSCDNGANFCNGGISSVPAATFDWTGATAFLVTTLSGGSSTGGDVTIRPNTADTTTGKIKLDRQVQLWPSFPSPPVAATYNLLRFDNTFTHSNSSVLLQLIDVSPTITRTTNSGLDYRVLFHHPTITNTIAPAALGYSARVFDSEPTFQSATNAVPPYMPDTFWDGTGMQMTANAATEQTWIAVSNVVEHVFSANGGNYTLGPSGGGGASNVRDAGMFFEPNLIANGTSTLVFSGDIAPLYVRPPVTAKAAGATLTLSGRYAAVYVEDLLFANASCTGSGAPFPCCTGSGTGGCLQFTSANSLYSKGSAVSLINAGPVRIGDTTAPTEKLEVAGKLVVTSAATFGTTSAASGTYALNVMANGGQVIGDSTVGDLKVGVSGTGNTAATLAVDAGNGGTTGKAKIWLERNATIFSQIMTDGTDLFIDPPGSGKLIIRPSGFSAGAAKMTLDSSGNLRIGDATAPTALLDLVAKFKADTNGIITVYNNVAKDANANGTPFTVATASQGPKSTGATSFSILATSAAADSFYNVWFYAEQAASGSGGTCATAASIVLNLRWVSPDAQTMNTATVTLSLPATLAGGTQPTASAGQNIVIKQKASSAITMVEGTFTNGNCSTQPTYTVWGGATAL